MSERITGNPHELRQQALEQWNPRTQRPPRELPGSAVMFTPPGDAQGWRDLSRDERDR